MGQEKKIKDFKFLYLKILTLTFNHTFSLMVTLCKGKLKPLPKLFFRFFIIFFNINFKYFFFIYNLLLKLLNDKFILI